ncbi:nucleotide disphospho-sugar-binding domain-containing protein [Actinomadura luteofluorescens]|uniref:nucleotide disphospho-sugar-binding domain-containing protein n=1 Tax=Actinomadura luteofluorescens TaxID=46163 RepID=UPI003481B5E1
MTVFSVAPLATAARNAGHEILLAANEPLVETATAIGIPAVAISPEPIGHFVRGARRRPGASEFEQPREAMLHLGRSYARMARAGWDALLDVAGAWSPDLVVGGAMSYAAGMLADRLKVAYVRHAWDIVPTTGTDPGAEEELRPELERLGLAGLPAPALFLDVCPPSLRPSPVSGAQSMRWIPVNLQRPVEPWMYTRPEGRRRVLITSGSRARMFQDPAWSLRHLAGRLADAEVLVAAPEEIAAEFGAGPGGVRAGWMPLDVVAPTCDLIMHHGGGATALTAMNAGVPQLITPEGVYMEIIARAVSGFGAGLTVEAHRQGTDRDAAEAIAAGCREILSSPAHTRRARDLGREIAALATPAETVRTLETLAAA